MLTAFRWEIEPHDPRDFGIPHSSWVPNKLFDEPDVAFAGLYQWRQRFNTVDEVTRSSLAVRATNPFVIIADNVRKGDGRIHKYQWYLTTADDLFMESHTDTDVILRERDALRRGLLIRVLATGQNVSVRPPVEVIYDEKHEKVEKSKSHYIGRLVLTVRLVKAYFKILLFPLRDLNMPLPETTWIDDQTIQINSWDQTLHQVVFSRGDDGAEVMRADPIDPSHSDGTCPAYHDSPQCHAQEDPSLMQHVFDQFHHRKDQVKEALSSVTERFSRLPMPYRK